MHLVNFPRLVILIASTFKFSFPQPIVYSKFEALTYQNLTKKEKTDVQACHLTPFIRHIDVFCQNAENW